MLTLYSYPGLFGLADNNPYGLKVYAFLKLCGLPFRHEHVVDTSRAPRGQLPFLLDDETVIGDSDTIIEHLTRKFGLRIDASMTPAQRDAGLFLRRTLDDLYWVMSFSRWKDERFWPRFRDAFLRDCPEVTADTLVGARDYNAKRYHYQGIGRYEPDAAYARGIADLAALANLLPESGFVFGAAPCSVDAGIFGFTANIYFYDIDTPLREFLVSKPTIVAHCRAMRTAVDAAVPSSTA